MWERRRKHQNWSGEESGNLLTPVHHLQNLFISSPFSASGPPRAERCRISTIHSTLLLIPWWNKLVCHRITVLGSVTAGPACIWDSDFSFLRVALCTSLYSIPSCWFLQFSKIISNADLILQSVCSLSKPGVICEFHNSTFYFII